MQKNSQIIASGFNLLKINTTIIVVIRINYIIVFCKHKCYTIGRFYIKGDYIMVLFVNGCVREKSRTLELAQTVLERVSGPVEEIRLYPDGPETAAGTRP